MEGMRKMSNERQETISDIVSKMRRDCPARHMDGTRYRDGDWVYTKGMVKEMSDRIEAAEKREADRIHRAMVIIAGIEMENSENPPRLWTALEDAYDALSDALGTDGDTSADVEEAKAIGRHFVIKSYGNAAAELHCSDCAWYHIYNDGLSELHEEALAARCSNCRFFQREHSHCTLNDSPTKAKYKCSEWKFEEDKECADNHEVAELRKENARLRAALKPVIDIEMDMYTSELSMEMAINDAKRIYNGGGESEVKE